MRVGLALPEVEESTSYGKPALKVGGKAFAATGHEPGSFALRVDREQRPLLLAAHPDVLHLTPHYERSSWLLVRLGAVAQPLLRDLLEDAWAARAPARLLPG